MRLIKKDVVVVSQLGFEDTNNDRVDDDYLFFPECKVLRL